MYKEDHKLKQNKYTNTVLVVYSKGIMQLKYKI